MTALSGVWIWLCSLGEDDGEEIGTENFLCGMVGEEKGGRKCEVFIIGLGLELEHIKTFTLKIPNSTFKL